MVLTVEDLAGETDNSGQTDLILLVFKKTFDKVSYKRLLLKLDLFGIRGTTKKWIECCLSNRIQQVVVEGDYCHTG